jgi:zinc protease
MTEITGAAAMNRSLVAILALAFALSGPVADAAPTIPAYGKVVSQSFDAPSGVTETHLANGLSILSKEVHAAPVAYFSVWYRVGARNEISGRTGLSHILEHMMFKGTKTLPPSAIGRLLMGNGAILNASTSQDRTEYHELIAADRLELAVKIEADRMMNSAFDPAELAREMTVVRSELEGKDNDPVHDLDGNLYEPVAFLEHPYHWPTIGWREDVEAVANRRDVIYEYYKQHYMPNNAFVVVVGDFKTADIVALCQKYFGVYPAGTVETHHITAEPPQRGERRVVLRRPGTTGHLLIAYHVPKIGQPDHYVLDVLSTILSSGRGSRLYRALVDTGLANNATGSDPDALDPYIFEYSASIRKGVAAGDVEKAINAEVEKLKTAPVTDDEIKRAVSQMEARYVFAKDSVSSQAGRIGTLEIQIGYKYMDTYLDRIRAVTPADIQKAAQTYFVDDNKTVAVFEPQPLPANTAPSARPVAEQSAAPAKITDPKQKAALDKLLATYLPEPAKRSATPRPKPTRVVLDNGVVVIVDENHANSTVSLSGRIVTGAMLDPEGKWGTARLTAALLPFGTESRTALQLALALESVGASVGIGASTELTNLSAGCQSKDFATTIGVLADELRHPTFPDVEFQKLRGRALSGLAQARQDTGGPGGAGTLADIAFSQAVYPKGHPYWQPTLDQQEQALKALTADDLKAFYSSYYRPDTLVLAIVGDVKTDDAIATVKAAFGDWAKPSTAAPTTAVPDIQAASAPAPDQAIVVDGSPQTSVLWGYAGTLHRNDKEFYAATVLSYILGGSVFDSRLGSAIRDKNGLAYTVSSNFVATHGAGPIQVFVGTNPNNARKAIGMVKSIVADVREHGVTADEVDHAKRYLTGSYPLRLETNSGIASQLLVGEDYGIGLDYIDRRNALIGSVTLADVNAAARKYLAPERATLVTAGAAVP